MISGAETSPAERLHCPRCGGARIIRVQRLWHESLRGRPPLLRCRDCEVSFCRKRGEWAIEPRATRYCWRCGGDLDRRRARTLPDRLLHLIGVRLYSCRGCNANRHGF